jgi:hypothetical protein
MEPASELKPKEEDDLLPSHYATGQFLPATPF